MKEVITPLGLYVDWRKTMTISEHLKALDEMIELRDLDNNEIATLSFCRKVLEKLDEEKLAKIICNYTLKDPQILSVGNLAQAILKELGI